MMKMMIYSVLSLSLIANSYAAKTLVFATEATYPPFASMNAKGQMIGFGPDIVHALCQQMHSKCQLVNNPSFASLIPDLQLGKYDALFGGMGITSQRQKVVAFTNPYYNDTISVITSKQSHFGLKQLSGKAIGVQKGSLFQTYVEKHYGSHVTMRLYQSNMQALLDLQDGRLQAVILDTPVAVVWFHKHPNSGLKSIGKLSDPTIFGAGVGIAVNKANVALVKKLNLALATIKANGTYQQIKQHYFGA